MIQFENVSFRYPGTASDAISGIDLAIWPGEYILVAGPSGSGKSTLLRCMNGLIPHFYGGSFRGQVRVDGLDTKYTNVKELSRVVGIVFQDPENQFVTTSVRSEIEFGQQNLGKDPLKAGAQLAEISDSFDLGDRLDDLPSEISGGEKQKVIIASVAAMGTQVLVLDEPTSQLDPNSASQIFGLLEELNRRGMTIILTEHRLKRALGYASRCLVMNLGKIVMDGAPQDLVSNFPNLISIGVRERRTPPKSLEAKIQIQSLGFRYPKRRNMVLDDFSLDIMKGELLGVIARNGGGKSTLARILAGLLKPYYGEIRLDGVELGSMPKSQLWRRIGIVFQDPNIHLFHDTVRDEIKFAQRNSGMEDGDAVMEEFGLKEVWARNPRDLSGGQKEKVAIASVVGYGPEVLILDEPTRGLDVMEKREIMTMVRKMVEDRGVTGIVLTHDLEMIGAFADRTVIISEGRVGFQGDPFEAVQKFSGE